MVGKPKRPTKAMQLTAERRAHVLELARQGHTQVRIAEILGASSTAISNDFKALHLPQKQSKSAVSDREARYVELANRGFSRQQIAEELGIHVRTLTKISERTGVRPRVTRVLGRVGLRSINTNDFVERFVENLQMRVDTIDIISANVDEVDVDVARRAAHEIRQAVNALNVFSALLRKRATSQTADGEQEETTT